MIRIRDENSDGDWQVITPTMFPDGTSQVWKIEIPESVYVDVKWNFENEAELIHLAQLSELLRQNRKTLNLYVPYFPYARQDKEVGNDKTFARTTLLNILRQCHFKTTTTFDVHSELGEYVSYTYRNITAHKIIQDVVNIAKPDLIFYPDEGALTRYGSDLKMPYDLLASAYAEKTRDQLTGKIIDYKIFRTGDLDSDNEFAKLGLIECLWNTFGGTTNEKGFKVLDSHIGAIYGDSITLKRARDICQQLQDKGFCSTNIVFGVGSYTYQYNTRDTLGYAMKATLVVINGDEKQIFKAPKTDNGVKKSQKGAVRVFKTQNGIQWTDGHGLYEEHKDDLLRETFLNGVLMVNETLQEVRDRLASNRL